MSSREEILQSLLSGRGKFDSPLPEVLDGSAIFKDFPESNGLLKNFEERLTLVKGECYVVGSVKEAAEKVLSLLPEGEICLKHDSLVVNSVLDASASLKSRFEGVSKLSLEATSGPDYAKYRVGVTGADCLISRSGSVVIRNTTTGGRKLSVLPEFHIVLAEKRQLVSSLSDWLKLIKEDPNWSYSAIITGPSRSADIEKILVLGAHGPKRLAVIVIS